MSPPANAIMKDQKAAALSLLRDESAPASTRPAEALPLRPGR
jgi:hypothetical protein